MVTAECVVCGKAFRKLGRALTCGKGCGRALANARHRGYVSPEMTRCVICGNAFRKRSLHTTCGPACRRARQNEYSARWIRARRKVVVVDCAVCGKGVATTRGKKACGPECRRELTARNRRRWKRENPAKVRESARARLEADRERVREAKREWRKANPEKERAYTRFATAARLLGLPTPIYAAIKISERLFQTEERPG